MCADEVDVYNYMIKSGIYTNENMIADRILEYYCKREEFDKVQKIIDNFSNIFNAQNKVRFFEKLKFSIESKIYEYFNSTILFPEIINRYLYRNFNDYSDNKENSNIKSNEREHDRIYIVELRNTEENLLEIQSKVSKLVDKFHLLKGFLIKYDANIRFEEESKVKDELNINKKPFSFLNKHRFPPVLPMPVITNILSNLNITYYYNNTIKSSQSSLVKLTLEKTKNLPTNYKLLYLTNENIDKALFEYLFKINTLVFLKYERECFLTKISFMKFFNNISNIRTFNINYAVKNIIYLHGIGDSYLGVFTPFYFILFDANKFSNLLIRFRFEIIQNHFTEESPIVYLNDYNPRCLAYSIFNIVYVIYIDTNRELITVKNKFEGHKREITKISFKNLETRPILISSSKNQIIMWNVELGNVFKILAIDDQLVVNELLLIKINVLCILTIYNQMYILEFGDGNNIKHMKITNFHDEQRIYQVSNDENFVFKLDSETLSLYNLESERNLVSFKDELFANYDLIFVHNDYVFKKNNNKGRIAIFNLI